MTQASDPLIGTTFAGRYRIERLLGAGGMGCVYTATQLSMNRQVALKVLNPDMSASDSAVQRFHREMQATSKVEHACTIRVYDFGRAEDGRLFLAMELLDGRTLHAALRECGAFDISRLLRIGDQVARALGAAHSEGIIHRDLKPENIMLLDRYGEKDVVKVLDFGIARFAAAMEDDDTPQLTKTGALIGTPLFMSPEQAMGRPVDHRSDIYSLGVLLYQMATGVPPFTDAQPVRVLFMHAQQAPKSPNELTGGRLPVRLNALILQMLAKEPDQRPENAAEVQRLLRRCSQSDTQIDGETLPAPKSRLAANPEAMAHARAAHADPQSIIATRHNSVTVDHDADDSSETLPGVGPGELVSDADAPTWADSAPAGPIAAELNLETAETMIAEPEPASGPQTERVELPGPKTLPAESTPSSRPWLIPLIAGVVACGGAAVWLASPGEPMLQPSAAEATEGRPEAPAEQVAEADAALAPLRAELTRLQLAAGDPAAPLACRLGDREALAKLVEATRLLADGRPRSMRPADIKAADLMAQVTATHGAQPEVAATLAKALLFSGRAADTVVTDHAEEAIAACPKWAQPHELVGRVHLLGGRSEAAGRHFQRALDADPDFLRAHYNLGLSALGRKDPAAGVRSFAAVLKRDDKHRQARLARGQAYLMAGQHAEAVADLTQLTTAFADDKLGWFLLGGAHAGLQDGEQAKRAWCKAGELGHRQAKELCTQK